MRILLSAVSILALSACGLNGTDGAENDTTEMAADTQTDSDNLADSMASRDPAKGQAGDADQIPDSEERPIMQAQVVLDRKGFGPGVIDGAMGQSTENALRGFQEANSLETTGKLDDETKKTLAEFDNIKATRVVTIPKEWGDIEFTKVPDRTPDQAKLDRLGYNNIDEKLAERFHTTVAVLKELNPGGKPAGMAGSANGTPPQPSPTAGETTESETKAFFAAGQQIRVPNVGADRIAPGAVSDEGWQETLAALGVGTDQPDVARIVVSEKAGTLKAFDAKNKLIALFTVTTGSKNDPLPLGEWGINGVGHNPTFSYDPELFWDVPDDTEKQRLPPGPNGPVGVVWIDLTKEHYGIHGTPAPESIGRAESHGCVRLTNWDAARLSEMVSNGTKVLFEA